LSSVFRRKFRDLIIHDPNHPLVRREQN